MAAAAAEYLNNDALDSRLQALARENSELFHVQPLGTNGSAAEVLLLEIGPQAKTRKLKIGDSGDSGELTVAFPAMLAVAGLEGNDLAGSAVLVFWAEQLARDWLTNATIKKLLDSTTIYLLPRLNREGAAAYFSQPRRESGSNLAPVDDDHDGMLDEDGPEDLDGDGQITWMRVEDPEGEYLLDPVDPRLMLKADRSRGEVGNWKLLPEGADNDQDEAWNEDGPGGVNLNRNFPYQFRFFATNAGVHPMSETLTRALADFVVARPEIGLVFSFGAADNLSQTPKGEAPKRPPTALHEEDVPFYRELGKAWRDAMGLGKELTVAAEPGTFSDWMYYHRGRVSLATRPWSPAMQLELAKPKGKPGEKPGSTESKPGQTSQAAQAEGGTTPGKDAKTPSEKGEGKRGPSEKDDKRNEEERAFLKWLDTNSPGSFVSWKSYQHPDFPGKRVEIGGLAPFSTSNPPGQLLESIASRHAAFLSQLPGKLPRIEVRGTKVKDLGNGVFDVTVKVVNSGYLPTVSAQGNLTREYLPTQLILDIDKKDLLSGEVRTRLDTIPGSGGVKETRHVVYARGRSEIQAHVISSLAGWASTKIQLKGE